MPEIYKPELVKEEPLRISNPGYAGDLPAGTRDGFIKTTMEDDVIIQRLSRGLYKNASSGIRELYANAARQCRQAEKEHGATPEITVDFNRETRELVIEERDSMGMSWDTFRNVFTVLGRSTNFDGATPGQFGMGRASYTCLGEIMILDVHSRETCEKFSVIGKNGIGWQTGLPEPKDMDWYGTRIRITTYDSVNWYECREMIRKCSILGGVRTYLSYDSDKEEMARDNLKDTTNYGDQNVCNFYLEDDDIEIRAGVKKSESWGRDVRSSYLATVPIEYRYEGEFNNLLEDITINIKNERKYPPTPDRERLKGESEKAITERIDALIEKSLKESEESESFEEYFRHTASRIAARGRLWTEDNKAYLGVLLSCVAYTPNSKKHVPLRDMPNHPETVLIFCRKFMTKQIEAITNFVGSDRPVVVFKSEDSENYEEFKKLGVKTADEFVKENGIAVQHAKPRKVTRGTVHRSWGCEPVDLDDIEDNCIVMKENLLKWSREMRWPPSDYGLIKHHKDIKGGIQYEDFIQKISGKEYATSDGMLSTAAIAASEKDVRIVLKESDDDERQELRHSFQNALYVSCDGNEYFEIRGYFDHHKLGRPATAPPGHILASLLEKKGVKDVSDFGYWDADVPALMEMVDMTDDTQLLQKMFRLGIQHRAREAKDLLSYILVRQKETPAKMQEITVGADIAR